MSISAQDVNKLRVRTNAGMMDCKKALIQAEGDFEKAIEILRKTGQKISDKRSDRETNEGRVFSLTNDSNTKGVLIALTCETDFVAKNKEFISEGQEIAKIALDKSPSTIDELKKLQDSNGRTIEEKITDLMGKIGEKVQISTYEILEGGLVNTYDHTGNNLSVIVSFEGPSSNKADSINASRDIAMQIAAMNPLAISEDNVPKEIVDKEFAIAQEQAKNEGKPEAVTQKIAEGKLKKFFAENTLVKQSYIKDPSMNIETYMKTIAPTFMIKEFKRVSIK